jgi:hypothetical protein
MPLGLHQLEAAIYLVEGDAVRKEGLNVDPVGEVAVD